MVKRVKKYADGGVAGLGQMIGGNQTAPSAIGGGSSAQSGLQTVNQGASTIGDALGRAAEAIGGGGGGGGGQIGIRNTGSTEGSSVYKKGGAIKIPKSKISTGEKSGRKKSPW